MIELRRRTGFTNNRDTNCKFNHWKISKPGRPPKIISCSKATNNDVNREKRSRRKLVKKRTPSEVIEKLEEQEGSENCENVPFDKPLLHSDSATLICDEVATSRSPFEISTNEVENVDIQSEPRDRHVSITSMESVAGLGEADDQDDVTILKGLEEVHEIEVDKTVIEESIPNQPKGQRFDLLSNGDVTIPAMIMNDVDGPKKKLLVRRKKKSKTPDSPPQYRDYTETSIYMYIEMDKQNVGEFVWDQQCTRIDALVAPIVELDRMTTPEIPLEIELFD